MQASTISLPGGTAAPTHVFSTFFKWASRTVLLLLFLALAPTALTAQPVSDNNVQTVLASGGSLSISNFSVPANNDRLLVAYSVNTGNHPLPTATFGTTTMNVGPSRFHNGLRVVFYYLVLGSNASATAATVTVTGNDLQYIAATSFHNVDQSDPTDGEKTSTISGSATSSLLTVSSSSLGLVCDAFIYYAAGGASDITVGSGQTQLFNRADSNPLIWFASSTEAGAYPSVPMNWTVVGNPAGGVGVHIGMNLRGVGSCPATGSIWYVDAAAASGNTGSSWACAFQSLQDAIDVASSGQEIWVKTGTYKPSKDPFGDANPTDPRYKTFYLKNGVKIYGGFAGTETARSQRNWTANVTTLSGDIGTAGNNSDNCYHVVISVSDANTTELDGFTVSGGRADSGDGFDVESQPVDHHFGGGMFNVATSIKIANCTFSGNFAHNGGGMLNYISGSPSLTNCNFYNNTANASGGGVFNHTASPTLTGCTFSGNMALSGDGGGMLNESCAPTLLACVFSNNSANATNGFGGGLANYNSPLVNLTNCLFSGNYTREGGALYMEESVVNLTNCTFSGNRAEGFAGNIFADLVSGSLTLKNCLIWNNRVGSTTGSADANLKVYNGSASITYSLIQNWNFAGPGNLNGIPNASNANYPNFVTPLDPATAPSSAGDFHIQTGSPAVNAGTNTGAPTTDLFGNPRPFGSSTDMGVHELQTASCPATGTIWYVDAAAASGGTGSSWACAFQNLQDAITAAAVGDEIWVKAGTYLPTLENGGTGSSYLTFLFDKNLKIYGGFVGTETLLSQRDWTANPTILSGNNNSYHVVTTVGLASTATLDGFTIKQGQASGADPFNDGAGVYNSQASSLVFANCVFAQNNALSQGGGMCSSGATPTLINCTFYGNIAHQGGGFYKSGGNQSTLTNCLFYGNNAYQGGGLAGGSTALTNCTVSGNVANGSAGGGIYFGASVLTNCIIWNNRANGVTGSASANIHSAPPAATTYSLIQNWSPSGAGNLDGIANAADANYPNFVTPYNPAGGNSTPADFHIQTGSPAANAGTNTGAPTTDLFGNPRPSGSSTDMGVHELQEAACPPTGTIWYVDAAAASGGTGSSWACAFQNVQDAINAASSGQEVWVKAGTYKPTKDPFGNASPTDPRDKTFYMKSGVGVYGGFAGTETARSQRNWTTNVTTLSGDIGTAGNNSDNCYHVVISVLDANTTVLDGFTIEKGNANGSGSTSPEGYFVQRLYGAGLYGVATATIISNCQFSSNEANNGGGCIMAVGSTSAFTNCQFLNNTSPSIAAGMMVNNSSPNLTDCLFSGNSAMVGGGGMYIINPSASPTLTRCMFLGNISVGNTTGGGIVNGGNSAILKNCLFAGNKAGAGSGMINTATANSQLINCTFSGNYSTNSSSGGAYYHTDGTSTLTNVLIWNNRIGSTTGSANANLYAIGGTVNITYSLIQNHNPSGAGNLNGIPNAADSNYPNFVTPLDPAAAPSTAGDFHVTSCSPILNLGTNTGAPTTDLFGNARPFGATVDMGVHELQSASAIPTIANAGLDQTDATTCGQTSVTLAGNTPTVGTGLWTKVSGAGGSFANTSSPASTFTGTAGTAYVLRWTISNPPCTASTDDVNITFNQTPTIANAGPDQTGAATCGQTSVTLAGNTPTVGTGLWTKVSGAGGSFSNASSPTSTFTGTAGQAYVLRWVISNSPCTASTDDVNVTFNVNPTMSCPSNTTVEDDDPAFALSGATPTGGAYSGTGVSSGMFNPATAGLGAHTITYAYTSAAGCSGTCTFTITVISGCPAAGTVWYVDAAAASGGTGTSWACAFQHVQDAINAASSGHEVWVKAGTYKPTKDFSGNASPSDPRTKTFRLKDGVGVYGGFAGIETARGQRNWASNLTTLSGDLGTANDNSDNAYNVVDAGSGTASGKTLDGFTVESGNANGTTSSTNRAGGLYCLTTLPIANCIFTLNEGVNSGGIYVQGVSPTFSNCVFSANSSNGSGGGAYSVGGGSPVFTACIFSGNSGSGGGGLTKSGTGTVTLTNCLFLGNLGSSAGGLLVQTSGGAALTNCTFSGNRATTPSGGAINTLSTTPLLMTNCLIWNNRNATIPSNGDASLTSPNSTPVITYSLLQNWSPSGTGNLNGVTHAALSNYPDFTTPLDPATAPSTDGDFHIGACSPAVNTGTNTGAPATDLFGNARPFGTTVDMGVHELQAAPTPAVALCQNATVQLDGAGNATLAVSALNNGSTGCTPLSFSASKTAFTCADLGANTVTLTVTGLNGATATCSATVTVADQVAPNALCRDFIKNLGTNGMATVTVAEVDNLSNDNCGTVNLLGVSPSSFACANIGTNTVTLTVNDGHGNTSTCNATVTVADNTAPTALCQNVSVNLSGNAATVTAAQVDNSSSDNCGTANLSLSTTSFACANVGANSVVLTVNDGHGNSSTCAATVTVADATNPTALCQNVSVNLNGSGMATVAASQINNGSSDNCGIAGLALSATSFTCSNIGANSVTLTVTDNNGRTATCAATVTVSDATNPTALCQNVTVNLDGNGSATLSAAQVDGGSTDNCGIASRSVTPNTFTVANIGTNTVTLTVTDNNARTASCTATVTVTNTNLPNAACQPYTVSLNGSGTATITAANVNGGSSAVGGIQSLDVLPNSFNCSNLGANTVTLTVTGNNGLTATCTTTVTVQDNTPPTVVCQDISVNLNGNGANITAAQVLNTGASTDNCGVVNAQSVSTSGFTCSNLGPNTVMLTANDSHGNTATCTATVTVVDNTAPTATCQNITIDLNTTGSATLGAAQVNNGSTDNCGTVNLVGVSPNSFVCANIGPNTVTLTVDDGHGNTAACAATVTVRDNTAPTALCRDVVLQLDANGNAALTAAQVNNGTSDNCTLGTLSVSPNTFTLANLGLNTVTLTVPDVNGNSASCTAQVTVENNQLPNVVCQNITRSLGTNGQVSISAADIDGGSTALGGIANRVASPNLLNCSNIGANTVTLTITGNNGRQASCNATVTINDATPPTAVCQSATVALNSAGTGTLSPSSVLNAVASNDNCGTVNTVNVTPNSFTCANLGANTVTLTVNDGHGNTATCNAVVTVSDNTAPGIVCPANQTVTGNATCQGTMDSYAALATKSDNCTAPGSINVAQSPASGGLFTGSQTVTLTATDGSNNTATCAFTVSVTDNTAPTITCPANQTVSADPTCQGTVGNYVALATKSDNCSAPGSINVAQSPISGTPIAGTTTVTLTATDAANNSADCIFSVSIRDVTPPTVGCPANQTVTGNATCQGTMGSYAALATKSDNCTAPGSINVAQSPASGGLFTGSQTVTLTATDAASNTATCAFTVSVTDNTAPTITCPANQTVSADATCQGTVGDYVALATKSDNCTAPGSINVAQNPISGTPIAGTTTVTLTATDAANNSADCVFSVSIRDVTPPTIVCPANQTVTGNATCQGTLGSYAALATKSDNCSAPGSINVSQSPAAGGLFTGSQTVTLTATDAASNSATCAFTVSVTDNMAPSITCPANQTVSANATCQGSVGNYVTLATKSDNCSAPGSINVAQSPISGTPIVGTTTVTLTATDATGNSATCAFSVSIRDVTPPTVGCPANQTVTANANCQGTLGSYAALATKSDNCSAPTNINVSQTPASGGLFSGSQTVVLTASDFSENTATCVFTVTVADNTAPTITCPANQTVSANASCQGTMGNYIALATKSDNCTAPNSIGVTQGPPSGTTISATTTVVLTATDASTNSAYCSFSVSIRDVTPPTVVCPANKTVSATTNVPCTAVVNGIDATFNDLCSSVSLAYALTGTTIGSGSGQASGLTFQAGSTTVTYAATDGAGLSASCAFTVYVNPCQVTLTGTITWKQDNTSGVKDATVTVTGDRMGSTTTATNGTYSLTLDPGSNFTLTPSKNLNKLNGVNAQDVQRLQQHLSGGLITNPWQLIAADVNGNNQISALDANILQLALLGNPSALDQMPKSWRFVPKTHTMASPPWGFPENIVLTGAAGTVNNLDFWGFKVGDLVSTYANPANLAGQPLVLTARDETLTAGQTLAVDVTADALRDLNALQMALRFDPEYLQLSDVQPLMGLSLTKDNFGTYQTKEGSLRVVWSDAQSAALRAGAPLFRLQFAVLEGGPALSEVLRLDDETLLGQVFNSEGVASGVSLRFEGVTAVQNPAADSPRAQLLQNLPNPFVHQTTIGFVLPEACEAQLRIMDAGGRVVVERSKQYPAGRHAETFDLNVAPGVLYYELTTPFGVLARKMVAAGE